MREKLVDLVCRTGVIATALALREFVRSCGVASYKDFCEAFGLTPVVSAYSVNGSISFSVLQRDPSTHAVVALAALKECSAVPHFHHGGEVTFTAFGVLRENLGKRIVSLDAGDTYGQGFVWDAGTLHQPWTEREWGGIYYQPRGMQLFDSMGKEDLEQVVSSRFGKTAAEYEPSWASLPAETLRDQLFLDLGFNKPGVNHVKK